MEKPASVQFPINDLLKHRWSPRAFADRDVDPAVLRRLFEAARWAASSYNGQPWSFVIATRGEAAAFQRVLSCFVEFNMGWAKNAPVIGISIAKLKFEHNGSPNRHAYHDVGQAMAKSGNRSRRERPSIASDGGDPRGQSARNALDSGRL